ncbi:310_t:CDS:2, partial [Funneliformis geosporum]
DTNCFSYPSRPVMWEIRGNIRSIFGRFGTALDHLLNASYEVFNISRKKVFGVKRERVSSFEFFGSLQHFARKFFWVFSISHESSLEVFSVDHLG